MRMLTESADLFSMGPANHLLSKRAANEAYCLSNGKDQHLLYFPSGGVVEINIPEGEYVMKGLRIGKAFWLEAKTVKFPGVVAAPHDESWAFVIQSVEN